MNNKLIFDPVHYESNDFISKHINYTNNNDIEVIIPTTETEEKLKLLLKLDDLLRQGLAIPRFSMETPLYELNYIYSTYALILERNKKDKLYKKFGKLLEIWCELYSQSNEKYVEMHNKNAQDENIHNKNTQDDMKFGLFD